MLIGGYTSLKFVWLQLNDQDTTSKRNTKITFESETLPDFIFLKKSLQLKGPKIYKSKKLMILFFSK